MKMKPLTKECLKTLGTALSRFGTYQFDDKGPGGVMNLNEIRGKFRQLSPAKAAAVIFELHTSTEYYGRAQVLAESIAGELGDWDALFEIDGMDEFDA
jgi:hypothetical protein